MKKTILRLSLLLALLSLLTRLQRAAGQGYRIRNPTQRQKQPTKLRIRKKNPCLNLTQGRTKEGRNPPP